MWQKALIIPEPNQTFNAASSAQTNPTDLTDGLLNYFQEKGYSLSSYDHNGCKFLDLSTYKIFTCTYIRKGPLYPSHAVQLYQSRDGKGYSVEIGFTPSRNWEDLWNQFQMDNTSVCNEIEEGVFHIFPNTRKGRRLRREFEANQQQR